MLFMETYFFYFSVRLGVVFISVLSFFSLFLPSTIFLVKGLRILKPITGLFNEDTYFRKNSVIKIATDQIENDSDNLKVLLQLYFFAHMIASALAFYGSLKLKKYFLLPIIFFEFCRVVYTLTFHILIMIASKSHINLGILIISTLAGCFLILFISYNWSTCVALYQIINLINSDRYKALYGEDPFNPLIPKTVNPMITENVRVLVTPETHDIDEQKKRNDLSRLGYRTRVLQPQPIISVLPVDYLENNRKSYRNNLKWKQSQWPTTTLRTPPSTNQNDNDEFNYNHWQWSELAPAILVKNKKQIYLY